MYRSFKPCYKWNTFNTGEFISLDSDPKVLNLVISGIPSILVFYTQPAPLATVLNLVISGIPSIL